MTIPPLTTYLPNRAFLASRLVWRRVSRQVRCLLGAAACSLFFCASTHAQTAHFSGATATVDSSFTPFGMAVDSAGDVFVADQGNSAVKEIVAVNGSVSSSSTVITIGSGFYYPAAVAVDSAGNVFVADALHNAVKEIVAVNGSVSSSSTVNTVGSGFNDPYAVAVDSAGNVFVADYGNNAVKEIVAVNGSVSSSSTVNTIGSGFYEPYGVAVDSAGDVFVGQQAFGAQQVATAVKEIVAVNGAVSSSSTVISVGSGFYGAGGMAVDSVGDIFVEDTGHGYLKEIVAVNGSVSSSSTVLTVARALSCYGVALDSAGHVFYGAYNAVKEYMTGGGNFGSLPVATSTPETISLTFTFDSNGAISAPTVLTQGATGLDFTDAGTGTCTTNGTSHTYNMGDTCTIDVKFTPTVSGIRYGAATLSSSGATIATGYVHGTGVGSQVAFSPGTLSTVGSGFSYPDGVAMDGAGDVFVADFSNSAVKEIVAVNGVVSASSPVNTIGSGFTLPEGVAVDGSGNVFVADYGNNAVKEIVAVNGAVSSSSTVNTVGSGFSFNSPGGVAVDSAGDVFVADSGNGAVEEIVAVNGAVSSSSTVNTISSGFSYPTGVAVDSAGDVFVADLGNSAVYEIVAVSGAVSSSSTVNTVGSGFNNPAGVAVDSAGDVFVADSSNNAVKEIAAVSGAVSSSSTVITVGSGFSDPAGVALSNTGNVFVGDYGNNAVKEIDGADAPSLNFATTAAGSTSSDSPQTLTVTNIGNAALSFEVPSTGLNPTISANFTFGNSSTCPQLSTGSSVETLAAGASCTELISFAPTTSGSKTGSLVMTDDALNATGPTYATQTISLSGTAIPPVTASTSVASTALTQNHAATSFTPVTGSGGTAPLTYSVSPTLPAGLSFSSSTGVVSGTATAVSAATTYTVTVTDANSLTANATFSLTVNIALSASTAIPSTALTQYHAAIAFTPVTGSGGTAPLTYSVSPTLPAGLSISSSGVVSGTPTAVSPATTYTVTVTDANGATATATFSLTVNIALSASTAIASTVVYQGHAATAFMPVAGSGGTAPLTYTVSPTLPAGLSFSSAGAVSGTPTLLSAAMTYTVTVTDANGETATATFSLTVQSITSTGLASSSLTPTYGATVVLTATVTPVSADTPPGTVSFYTGSTLLGTVALNSTGVVTLSTALPLGPNTVTAVYSGSARYAASSSSPISIFARTGTSVTFSATPSAQLYSNPIVLTAQATSLTAGSLTGTMTFLDGTTVIGAVPLGANGQATYSTTTLADGSHSVTASYSGDANYLASVSASTAAAITVDDIHLSVQGVQNQSVVPGTAAAYTLQLSSLITPTFLYDVHLTATGLPAGATYTFSPTMIPAGSGSLPVTLTVQTVRGVASLTRPTAPGRQNSSRGLTALAFGLLLPLLGAKQIRKRLKAMPGPLAVILFTALCMGVLAGLTGCGAGGFYGPTATSGNYTITVTATSANLVRTTTVQLTIQ